MQTRTHGYSLTRENTRKAIQWSRKVKYNINNKIEVTWRCFKAAAGLLALASRYIRDSSDVPFN